MYIYRHGQGADMGGKALHVDGQSRDPPAIAHRADAQVIDLFQYLFLEVGVFSVGD